MTRLPALSLAAVPNRRQATLELAQEIERKGYPGIYAPSLGDSLALCQSLAHVTHEIEIGTSIMPIYFRQVVDFASTAGYLHEVSNGRFRFGIGVSHVPALKSRGLAAGKPLSDVRDFVEALKAVPRVGEMPPIILATLRQKMIRLAAEIGDGMVFANGARSYMSTSLAELNDDKTGGTEFFIGNMIPTCISEDIEAAKAVNRKTLTSYAMLPNYRNYWKAAGYVEEMEGVEAALATGDRDRVPHYLTDRWLADTTLFGSASSVREGIEAWFDAGIKTPIIVPSSANGGQMVAFSEFLKVYD